MRLKFLLLSFCTVVTFRSVLSQDKTAFNFIAFGDMPYTLPKDYVRFENVIKSINEERPAFTINVGDLKSGSTPCTQESYEKMLGYFHEFERPLIYTPGDNEWTDCNRKEAGTYDPEERLEVIRKLFFKNDKSFGIEKLTMISQSKQPDFSKYVENNRWDYQNVSFATLHVVGTNNNFVPTSKNGNKEFYEREAANLAWLREVFEHANLNNRLAIVLAIHADMFDVKKDGQEADGFASFKNRLRNLAIHFKKPVLLINGDSHVFLIDKPFQDRSEAVKSLNNFTRLQVPGENNMHAVRISVNPATRSVFQIEELVIPGN